MKKIFLLIIVTSIITACGLKALPEPDLADEIFSWNNLTAVPLDDCIFLSGQVVGNIENLIRINFEVQELTESCEACPFVPEMQEFYVASDIVDSKSGVFQMNYCPPRRYRGDEYRWRIVGNNILSALPQVVSPIFVITMKDNLIENFNENKIIIQDTE